MVRTELCKTNESITRDSLKEVKLVSGSWIIGRLKDESVVVCEII